MKNESINLRCGSFRVKNEKSHFIPAIIILLIDLLACLLILFVRLFH